MKKIMFITFIFLLTSCIQYETEKISETETERISEYTFNTYEYYDYTICCGASWQCFGQTNTFICTRAEADKFFIILKDWIIKMWNEESRGNPPYTISKYKVEMFINNQPGIPFPEIPDELVTYVYPSNELTTTIYP